MALWKHQQRGIQYAVREPHPALFWEMRLGKSRTCIRRVRQYGASHVLIVAPYSALYGWQRELELEEETSIAWLTGTRLWRLEQLENGCVWNLINKKGHLVVPEIARYPWDVVILDESRFVANPHSKVSKFYTKNFRRVRHRWALTGTPASQGPLDYVQQLRWLGVLPENYWQFRIKYCTLKGFDWTLTKKGATYLYGLLRKHCSFLSRADVKMGGKKIFEQRVIEMPKDVRKLYNQVRTEFALNKQLTIHATTQFIWMRRLCGGLLEDGTLVHEAKLNDLQSLLDGELKGQQVVVWTYFIQELLYLHANLDSSVVIHGKTRPEVREQARKGFESGRYRTMVIQPACFKYGTDLSAASTMYVYSTPFGETREQIEDRVIKLTRNDSVLILDSLMKDTIEQDIHENIGVKRTQKEIIKWYCKQGQEVYA